MNEIKLHEFDLLTITFAHDVMKTIEIISNQNETFIIIIVV